MPQRAALAIKAPMLRVAGTRGRGKYSRSILSPFVSRFALQRGSLPVTTLRYFDIVARRRCSFLLKRVQHINDRFQAGDINHPKGIGFQSSGSPREASPAWEMP